MSGLNRATVWVLEDDPGATFVYREVLGPRFGVTCFETLEELRAALERAGGGRPALPEVVIADILLGDGTFLDFLQGPDAALLGPSKLLCISVVDDLDTLRLCYAQGATDYLVKPFNKNELIAKVEHALNGAQARDQASPEDEGAVRVGRTVVRGLTTKERQLLSMFLAAPDNTVERRTLLKKVWAHGYVQPKTVDVHLYNLRRKLKPHRLFIHSTGKGRWSLRDERGWRVGPPPVAAPWGPAAGRPRP